nr:BspA family leucine-rich repeat surface protein [Bifidobacterium sp. ESL0784]
MSGDFSYVFQWLHNVTSIDFSNATITGLTGTEYMFRDDYSLKSIDLSGFDTSGVTNMASMFEACKDLQTITFGPGWSTARVTDMNNMFNNTYSLVTPDFSTWDTSQVTDMSGMFAGSWVSSLDLSNFNTSQHPNMQQMFDGCTNLQKLDISGFDTTGSNMMYMFRGSPIRLLRLGPNSQVSSGSGLKPGPFNMVHKDATGAPAPTPEHWEWEEDPTPGTWNKEGAVTPGFDPSNGIPAPSAPAWYGNPPNMSVKFDKNTPATVTDMPSDLPTQSNCWPDTPCGLSIPTTAPQRTGFIFKGWTDDENPGKTYQPGDSIDFNWHRWDTWNEWVDPTPGNPPKSDNNALLKAHWLPRDATEPLIDGITARPTSVDGSYTPDDTITVSGAAPGADLGTGISDPNRDTIEVGLMKTAGSTSTASGDAVNATSVTLDASGNWTATFHASDFTDLKLDKVGTGTDYSFRARRVSHDGTKTNYQFKHNNNLDIVAPGFGSGADKLDYKTPAENGGTGIVSGTVYTSGDGSANAQPDRNKLASEAITLKWLDSTGAALSLPIDTATTDANGKFTINWPAGVVENDKVQVSIPADAAGNSYSTVLTLSTRGAAPPEAPTGAAVVTPVPKMTGVSGSNPTFDQDLKVTATVKHQTGDNSTPITVTGKIGSGTAVSATSVVWDPPTPGSDEKTVTATFSGAELRALANLDTVGNGATYTFTITHVNSDNDTADETVDKTIDLVAPGFDGEQWEVYEPGTADGGARGVVKGKVKTAFNSNTRTSSIAEGGVSIEVQWCGDIACTPGSDVAAATTATSETGASAGKFNVLWPSSGVSGSNLKAVNVKVTDSDGNTFSHKQILTRQTPDAPADLALQTPLVHVTNGTLSGDIVLTGTVPHHVANDDVITATATRGGVTINSYGVTSWSGNNWSVKFHATDFASGTADPIGTGNAYTFTASRSVSSGTAATKDLTNQSVDEVAPAFEPTGTTQSRGHLVGTVWSSGNSSVQSSRTKETGVTLTLTWKDNAGTTLGTSTTTSGADGAVDFAFPSDTWAGRISQVDVQAKDTDTNESGTVTVQFDSEAPDITNVVVPKMTNGAAAVGDIVVHGTLPDYAVGDDVHVEVVREDTSSVATPVSGTVATSTAVNGSARTWTATFPQSDFSDTVGKGSNFTFYAYRTRSGHDSAYGTPKPQAVDMIAPTPGVATPQPTGSVTGTTRSGGSVAVDEGDVLLHLTWKKHDGTPLGTSTTVRSNTSAPIGKFTATPPDYAAAATKVSVYAEDAAGNTSAATDVDFTLTYAPTITSVTAPKMTNGVTVTSRVKVSGTLPGYTYVDGDAIEAVVVSGSTAAPTPMGGRSAASETIEPDGTWSAEFNPSDLPDNVGCGQDFTFYARLTRDTTDSAYAAPKAQKVDMVAPGVDVSSLQLTASLSGVEETTMYPSTHTGHHPESGDTIMIQWMRGSHVLATDNVTSGVNGSFSATPPAAAASADQVTMQSKDAVGNTASVLTKSFDPDAPIVADVEAPKMINGTMSGSVVTVKGNIPAPHANDEVQVVTLPAGSSSEVPTEGTTASNVTINRTNGDWEATFPVSDFPDSVGIGQNFVFRARRSLVQPGTTKYSAFVFTDTLIDMVAPQAQSLSYTTVGQNGENGGTVTGKVVSSASASAQPNRKVEGGATVQLTWLNADGKPLQHAQSLLKSFTGTSATTNADGTFTVAWPADVRSGDQVEIQSLDVDGNSSTKQILKLGTFVTPKPQPAAQPAQPKPAAKPQGELANSGADVAMIALTAVLLLAAGGVGYHFSRKHTNNEE